MTPLVLILAASVLVTGARMLTAGLRGFEHGLHLEPVQQPQRLAYRLGRWVRTRRDQSLRNDLAAHRQEHCAYDRQGQA